MQAPLPEQAATKSERLFSIDVFRGLTIFVMILVNDLAGIRNIPGWMKHMPADADGMTFVDVVFPAFLFIVGMAIPLAISKRLANGNSIFQLGLHILIRTFGLLILGVLMINIGRLNPQMTGLGNWTWALFIFIAAILVWNQYPKADGWKKIVFTSLKVIGIVSLLILIIIYRSGKEGEIGWLHTSWWGILGLIGWSYLVCSLTYLLFRQNIAAYVGMLAFFIVLYIGDKTGALKFLGVINNYISIGGHIGGHASLTTAGMILSLLFMPGSPASSNKQRFTWLTGFTIFLMAGGYLLRPLYGISKIYATPSWALYCSVICVILFALLYWMVDYKKIVAWANFLKPAGANPLLAYILPDILHAVLIIFGIDLLSKYFGEGLIGITRSLILSLLMLWATSLLTRWHVRLHL